MVRNSYVSPGKSANKFSEIYHSKAQGSQDNCILRLQTVKLQGSADADTLHGYIYDASPLCLQFGKLFPHVLINNETVHIIHSINSVHFTSS